MVCEMTISTGRNDRLRSTGGECIRGHVDHNKVSDAERAKMLK
jgi:hypothetical protein